MTNYEALYLACGGDLGVAWLLTLCVIGLGDLTYCLVCGLHWCYTQIPHKIRYARIRRQRRRTGSSTPPPPPPSSN